MRASLWATLGCIGTSLAQITIYGLPNTSTAFPTPTQLTLAPPPNPTAVSTASAVAINAGQTLPQGLPGKTVYGDFMGWSLEMSVSTDFLGQSNDSLRIPFLNYLASQQSRARKPLIVRIGGNTQDSSSIDLAQNKSIVKSRPPGAPNSYTGTPDVSFGPSLLATMKAVGDTVPVRWIFGLQLKNVSQDANDRLVAEQAEAILGDQLLSLQIGNEPDLYSSHGERDANYSIPNFVDEFGQVVTAINQSSTLSRRAVFSGPSVCCDWTPDQVIAAGFLTDYGSSMSALAVQHYPNNNCVATGKINGTLVTPEQVLPEYLSHYYVKELTSTYNVTAASAVSAGLSLIMTETGTASCGGFAGVSDSFVSALWGVDYCLSMAATGFDNALFHVSGRSTYYNAFTSPLSNDTTQRWTTGPIYYAALFVTEAFGSGARSVDLTTDDSLPVYAVYDNNENLSRMVFVNYLSNENGTVSDYQAAIPSTSDSVVVKYLSAPSTTAKSNITFAGQNFDGGDGLPVGTEQTTTVACTNGSCVITIPASSAALVFMNSAAVNDVQPSGTTSFAMPSGTSGASTPTVKRPVPTVDAGVLATSNGQGGAQMHFGYSGVGPRAVTSSALHTAAASFGFILLSICTVFLL